jgi:hypothetical protein
VNGAGHPGRLDLGCSDGSVLSLTGDLDLIDRLRRLWHPFVAQPGDAARPGHLGDSHGTDELAAVDLATTCAEVNRAMVARLPWPAVHSGVVAVPSGAVAFPAVSGAGKSTLTAALCLAGARYLSDEALVLDGDGDGPVTTLPYPKPVALSPWSAAALRISGTEVGLGDVVEGSVDRELLFAPDALAPVSGPSPLAHILLPVRHDGDPELVELPRPQALATLLEMSFNHFRDPRRFLMVSAAAVNGARVHRLHVGEPTATARLVVDRLG